MERELDHTSATDALEKTRNGLVFVVGSGRCGSTVLRAMFDSHTQFCMPSETHFFSLLEEAHRQRFEDGATKDAAIRAVLQEERIAALRLDEDRVRELFGDTDGSWESFFVAAMTAYREGRERPRVGDKTPRHILRLDHLYKAFPDAKFIHVVRDPRAVVASSVKTSMYLRSEGSNPYRAIERWQDAIHRHRRALGYSTPERYTTVRYEDLVTEPEAQMRRMTDFVGLEFEPTMLDYKSRAHVGYVRDDTNRDGIRSDLHTTSVDKWRKQLSPELIQIVEHLCKSEMEEFEYVPEATAKDASLERRVLMMRTSANVRGFAKTVGKAVGLKRGKPPVPIVD